MLHLIIRIKRAKYWWRVTVHDKGLVENFAFIHRLLIDWLRSTLKGKP